MSSAPSRSSADPALARALRDAVDRTVAAIRRLDVPAAVVLVDGRSGAGKTTFSAELADAWPGDRPVQSVALDALYPGWDGLDAGVAEAVASILAPHARGERARWRRWDWGTHAPAEGHEVDPAGPLLVEGAGLLTAASQPLGHVRVWIDAPAAVRRARALARDGETYRPHWERWAAQEERHVARDDPRRRATIVVDLP